MFIDGFMNEILPIERESRPNKKKRMRVDIRMRKPMTKLIIKFRFDGKKSRKWCETGKSKTPSTVIIKH